MIILNLLNRIFGHRGSLSRDEISSYQKKDNAQSIEEKSLSDDFDSDAIDGWVENDIPIENMSDLDKKFNSKFNSPKWSSSTILFFALFFLASAIILTFTYNLNKNNQNQIVDSDQNKQPYITGMNDSIDKISREEDLMINKLKTIPKEKEVKPNSLKRLSSSMEEEKVDTIKNEKIAEPSTQISPEIKNTIPVEERTETLIYAHVDEFYLHDFKLIDYRNFRNAPIKKRKLVPVGTPADQEYYGEANQDDFVWKDIDIPYVEYLDESMESFEKSNYKRALKRFNTILKNYDDDINAHFYGGLCYYNLGEYEKAIEYFDDSYNLEFGNFRQEVLWFKAKALLELNKKESAKKLLNRIISENNFYAKEAKDLLMKLEKL
jgi:TolA-binding protein